MPVAIPTIVYEIPVGIDSNRNHAIPNDMASDTIVSTVFLDFQMAPMIVDRAMSVAAKARTNAIVRPLHSIVPNLNEITGEHRNVNKAPMSIADTAV